MLGFPASAGPRVPEETWGTLENDRKPREPVSLTSVGETVWMQALDVRHGYSCGPIFDPRVGLVVGIRRGIPDMPRDSVDIGPGLAQLTRFIEDAELGEPASKWGDDPLAVARRATVHVICRIERDPWLSAVLNPLRG